MIRTMLICIPCVVFAMFAGCGEKENPPPKSQQQPSASKFDGMTWKEFKAILHAHAREGKSPVNADGVLFKIPNKIEKTLSPEELSALDKTPYEYEDETWQAFDVWLNARKHDGIRITIGDDTKFAKFSTVVTTIDSLPRRYSFSLKTIEGDKIVLTEDFGFHYAVSVPFNSE